MEIVHMTILLLGGTGILSTDFTHKCLDEGNDVFILNRGKRQGFIDTRANLIVSDLRKETAEEIRVKVNNIFFDVIVDYLSFEPTHLEKTLKTFEGIYKQYIFISSATAYIKLNDNVISEESNKVGNPDWSYSLNKSRCEEYLRRTDVNYTIIRPYVTYGESRLPFQLIPDGFHYTLLERIKNDKPVALLDGGSAVCTLTNTVDFANVLYGLLLNKRAYRQAFHITSKFQQTWKEVYETYCEILEHKPKLVSVSLEDIKKYMPEFYQPLKGDKGTSWRFDNTKVLEAIGGYEFQIDLKTGLRNSIVFYETHNEMQGIDYKWDGKMDYMLRKVSGIKNLKPIESNCDRNNDRCYYDVMSNPLTHFAYMVLWNIKHRV
jgi:nucleoside-diphosphate-sugar epimerase